jgi:hypothetical protein
MKTLRKFLIVMLLSPVIAWACSGWVIGFRGQNEVFDYEAFADYAELKGRCVRSFRWQDHEAAEQIMSRIQLPYELYGFSRGAETVRLLLERGRVRPDSVITVGAFRTVNVNFDRYGIPYRNYFDRSGQGQLSPGVYLDVDHGRVQRTVVEIYRARIHGRVANIGLRATLIKS